jgi:hypothetical protein
MAAAFIAKFTKCGQKQGPQLHGACSAIQGKGDDQPDESEENINCDMATQHLAEG